MNENEGPFSRQDNTLHPAPDRPETPRQLDLDIPSLETALQSAPFQRLDWHLGPGVVFRLGTTRQTDIELYSQVVRVMLPTGQLAIPRRDAEVVPDGVVFQDPDHFFLSVGPTGDVLFQYFPPSPAALKPERPAAPIRQPVSTPDVPQPLSPSPAPPEKQKAKSERYVGRMGEVRTHRTKQGKVVAEVELTVPDPDRPGASLLVKLAAFGEKAEALKRDYQPGQLVSALGIPHELQRRGKDGQAYRERQIYLVRLPKIQ